MKILISLFIEKREMDFDPFKFTRNRFPYLTIGDVTTLLKGSKLVKLKASEIFIPIGKKTERTAFIIKGLLRSYRMTDQGEEKTILFRKEFEVIGSLQSMVMDQPANEEVQALENSWVFEFNFQRLRTMSFDNLRIARAYNRIMELMLVDAVERISAFTLENPEERYLNFLKENKGLVQRVPLKYLASYLGITPYSLSRIRKRISSRLNK